MRQLTQGEQRFIGYLKGTGGGFFASLFDAMTRADPENRDRLMLVFPEEMSACYRYHNEPGYAEELGLA